MADFPGKKLIWLMTSKSSSAKDQHTKKRRVFGRRQSRPLRASRKEAFETLLPKIGLAEDQLSGKADLDPQTLFPNPAHEVWMEIGFGSGEHLAALIEQNKDINFLGAEPYIDGMAAFLKSIMDKNHSNIRVFMDDALILTATLTDASIDRLYVLNPDPWHKKRHHKRRIINQENLGAFARILKPGALLIMSTDVDDLADWMVTEATRHPDFEWTAECARDWTALPAEMALTTRYAQKGITAGRTQRYLVFKKL